MTEIDPVDQVENRVYELGFHVVSSIPEEKLPAEVTIIKDVLTNNGAVVISEDFPKLKNLAYQMTKVVGAKHLKFNTAYFGWVKFEINPESIDVVKKAMEKNDNIVRFLIVKTVRESTMSVIKPAFRADAKPAATGEIPKNKEIKAPVSEAELDKTIDSLMVE
ncbi:MAG: 30S ribosomal protein S6 [Patescibacteria group bacterium]